MNKKILDNILGDPSPAKRYATVERPLGNNRFVVKDLYGRKIEVDSATPWNVGEGVTVDSNGRIVDKASRIRVKKLYQV